MKPDEDKCLEDLLKYLFKEKIEPNLIYYLQNSYHVTPNVVQNLLDISNSPFDINISKEIMNWKYPIKAMSSMSIINHINYHCKTDKEIYLVFTKEALIDTLSNIINTVLIAKISAELTGYLDVIDDNFQQISNGIKVEQLPAHHREILQNLGSKDPEVDLCALLQVLLLKKDELYAESQKLNSAQMLEKTIEKLKEDKNQIKELVSQNDANVSKLPDKKRWGLFGIILKGASIIVPDIVHAATPFLGTTNIDILKTVKTEVESISSVHLGIQTVRDSYNKLKNES
jgi:hypothetical protein